MIPHPSVLRTIRNKATQKKYYTDHQIPTSEYILTHNIQELADQAHFFPAVHKIAEGGYDGRGVQIIETEQDVAKGFDAMSVLEKQVTIEKEIAFMIAISRSGDIAIYPPVQMIFDKGLNLLDFQLCPAEMEEKPIGRRKPLH